MLRTELVLDADNWLWELDEDSSDLPADIGIDYTPPQPRREAPYRACAKPRFAPPLRACVICENPLTDDVPIHHRTCSKACSQLYTRAHLKAYRSQRYNYTCAGCSQDFEVGFSMWEEVRARGTLCHKCHAARAPERGLILADNRVFKLRKILCGECAHGYVEPAAHTGFACRANARVCVPHVFAKLFIARTLKPTEEANDGF